jgi:hypothetical protein
MRVKVTASLIAVPRARLPHSQYKQQLDVAQL